MSDRMDINKSVPQERWGEFFDQFAVNVPLQFVEAAGRPGAARAAGHIEARFAG